MKDLGALVHFKTRNRGAEPGGPGGGYCRVYGRFSDWETYEEEVRRHFRRHFRYDVVDFEEKETVESPKSARQAALIRELDRFPIQYLTMQLYPRDDAH
jgi:hypothetical protein